jgi:hypothetical protein
VSYVRLKHTLSSLALEMFVSPPRRRPIAWLRAYVRLSPHGDDVPLAQLRRKAAGLGTAGPRSLERLVETGLLRRTDHTIGLAPEFRPYAPYLGRHVERLGTALDALGDAWHGGRGAVLQRGALLFNCGLFFECHEYLEDVWRYRAGPDRNFYHGLIQAAAAFYHFEKNNLHGTRTLLGKALSKLEAYRPAHLGVDVEQFVAELASWQRRFAAGEPGRVLHPQEFPRIRGRATIGATAEG